MSTKRDKRPDQRLINKTRSAKMRGILLAIASILLFTSSGKAQTPCQVETSIGINTGYNYTTSAVVSAGSQDPNWTVVALSPACQALAPSTPPYAAYVPPPSVWPTLPLTNSRWISFLPAGGYTTSGNEPVGSFWMVLQRTFRTCENDEISFSLKIANDNYCDGIKIDGVSVPVSSPFSQPVGNPTSNYQSYTTIPLFTMGLNAGTHTIQITIKNHPQNSPNPHGLNIDGTISSAAGHTSLVGPFSQANCSCAPIASNCSDTCYWKVQGNNILNGNNIFGTLTNNDVRIFTNNQPVGIIKNTGRYGFGNMAPNNRVEITHGTPSNSGLRFTNLNSSSATTTNTGKVLSVDANGDVVLVNNGGGGSSAANNGLSSDGTYAQLGQDCDGGSGAELLNDRAIPMNDHNLIFRDGHLEKYSNRVGIGTGSCVPGAKLDVIRNDEGGAYESDPKAFSAVNLDNATKMAIGIYGAVNNEKNPYNTAGYFNGGDAARGTFGVLGIANSNGKEATGGRFEACGAYINIGVYAVACDDANNGNGPSYAGYFDGDLFTTSGVFTSSDSRLKKNITSIPNAMELLNRIQPKKYQFDHSKYPALNLPTGTENYGVIAQELEEVLPALVKETPVPDGDKGFLKETIKAVNYTELIPILIQAVKDQQKEIDELKAGMAHQGTGIGEAIKDKGDGYLAQNVPNPFSVSTVIRYQLPAGTQKAAIGIYDMNGKELRLFQLSAEKEGSVTIKGNELTPGMYLYSFIVDGKYFDSKKMVLTSN